MKEYFAYYMRKGHMDIILDYDLLGNPFRIQFSNGNVTEYVYSADGRRLQTTHRTAVSGISIGTGQVHTLTASETMSEDCTDYYGDFIYENDVFKQYNFAEGYSSGGGSARNYHYYIRDHQGNNRVVANYQGTIEQTTHYYPYGGILSQSTNQGVQKYKYNGKEFDRMHGLDWYDYGARQQDPETGMFTSMDPMCEKYYNVSPYAYCAGNPVTAIDPDGMDIYMLFYTKGNGRGDEMFKSAAETRKYDIEHNVFFDAANDIVLMCGIQDIGTIGSLVSSAVDSYGDTFGKTAEFSVWSHAGKDGPIGTVLTSHNTLDGKQMTLEGWSNIDFNWASGANANFYGCKTGIGDNCNPSFSARISSLNNYRDVSVHGQTSSAYPSIYTNVRQNTQEMINGTFSYPTYMVGGPSLGVTGCLFPTSTQANPMRTSRNGRGVVDGYYQPGKRR